MNLFHGHSEGERKLTDEAVGRLRRLTDAAAAGYIRLIALQKRGGS